MKKTLENSINTILMIRYILCYLINKISYTEYKVCNMLNQIINIVNKISYTFIRYLM